MIKQCRGPNIKEKDQTEKCPDLQVGGLHQRGASVYLFGFLFLHQAVETPKPCKFVKLSSSQVHTLGDTLQTNIKPPCYDT